MPSSLRLEDECRGLSEVLLRGGFSSGGSVDPIEMPGQYLAGNEVQYGDGGRDMDMTLQTFATHSMHEVMNQANETRTNCLHSPQIPLPSCQYADESFRPPPATSAPPCLQVSAESVVLLESFGSNVAVVRRPSASHRRLVLYGSDGHARHMLVQAGQNWTQVRGVQGGGGGRGGDCTRVRVICWGAEGAQGGVP